MTKIFEVLAKNGVIVLPENFPCPSRCIVAVLDQDLETLRREASMMIAESKQHRMSELLTKNREGQISDPERSELDALSQEFDTATLAKGRAISLLSQLDSISPST